MSFFLKKSFLIFGFFLLKPLAVFAAPSFWDACKSHFGLGTVQTVVSSETVSQKSDPDSSKEDTLKILLIRHGSTASVREEFSLSINEANQITKEKNLLKSIPFLSKEGAQQFERRCANLENYSFDLLVHSPTLRTWQTAQIFLKYFPTEKVEQIDGELSGIVGDDYDYDEFFNTIKAHQAKSVVLVHHQPFLNMFLTKAYGFDFNMSKGSMILLEFPYPYTPGSARIVKMNKK